MKWTRVKDHEPSQGYSLLIWRVATGTYDVASFIKSHGFNDFAILKGKSIWETSSSGIAAVEPEDKWLLFPWHGSSEPQISISPSEPMTITLNFWNKVKDKKPPFLPKILLGWVEEGEFFYTVARIEPHVDDPETLMWTDYVSHGLPNVLLTNHYWAEVPSIWPGLPAAMLH